MFLYAILVYWRYLHTSFVFLLRKLSSTVTIFPNKGTSLDIHIPCFTFIFQKYLITSHRIWNKNFNWCTSLTSSGYLIEKSSRVLHGYTVPDCMYDGKAAAAFYPRVHGKVEKGIESSIAAS